jgi:protein-L-isoaspartate O-methyltransferase
LTERQRLRFVFEREADRYDRVRPGYPPQLFDDLAELAGIGPGCRVLEIGCGTGRATIGLAQRGCSVLALELGPTLAEIASAHLAGYDNVRIEVADFDHWTPTEAGFDVVFAATAYHWLDPATRDNRTANLMRKGGVLATVATHHMAGGTEQFFRDVQASYRRYDPTNPPHLRLHAAAEIPLDRDLGSRYGRPTFRRYEWTADYRTAEYLDLLRTYSGTPAPTLLAREGVLRDIGALIDGRYNGRITKRYLTELRVAQVRPT